MKYWRPSLWECIRGDESLFVLITLYSGCTLVGAILSTDKTDYVLPMIGVLGSVLWYWSRSESLIRRRREEFCIQCGYNLYGNASGRCPECGWQICTDDIARYRSSGGAIKPL